MTEKMEEKMDTRMNGARIYKVEGSSMNYQMPAEVDHHVSRDMCREIDSLVETYRIKELILDFSKTEFMDSSGIGVIIGRSKTMRFYGGELCVTHLNERMESIFQSVGLKKIVRVKED